jgi:hypothetical protein
LAKDLAIANKPVYKALAKKRTTATNTAKTISKIVSIRQKLALKLRPKAKKNSIARFGSNTGGGRVY